MNNSIKIVNNIFYIFRQLQQENSKFNHTINNDIDKQQLRDLYIYLSVLVSIIIIILGGYALYKKCMEKKALEEMEREYQLMLMNLINSNSSQSSSSQEYRRPHSYNNINQNNIRNIVNEFGSQNINNSLDFNHEERMEIIRKKFGNSIVIKCLLKKQIEEILYLKSYAEEYGDNCTICMENFIENVIISKTPCEHIFHKKCFDKYLKEIQKKDKLLCPNCNQNLLINKKFLKLRAKTKKVEVVNKNIICKKEIKESELNLENEFKNRNSVMTNKNEDPLASINNNEIIYIKKKGKRDKKEKEKEKEKAINIDFLNEKNEDNIYNPLQIYLKKNISENSKNEKDTVLPNKESKINQNDEIDNLKKRTIVLIHNFTRKNNNNLKKDSVNNNNELKLKLSNKRKINVSDVSSERDCIVLSKRTCVPIMSSSKQDNNNI